VIEAVEHHLAAEHVLDPRALEIIGKVHLHPSAGRSIAVQKLLYLCDVVNGLRSFIQKHDSHDLFLSLSLLVALSQAVEADNVTVKTPRARTRGRVTYTITINRNISE
jgi:hypothetical protein